MNTSKIIKGVVGGGRYTVTAPIVKEDYGLYLKIEGLELPSTYEVDFSNSEHNGTSVTMIGNSDGVLIPSQFISSGKDVFAFLYHVGEDYGRTIFKFRIPNKLRPDRTDEQPTPEQESVIDQAISALNDAVAQTAQDVIDADASAQSASQSAENAHDSAVNAQNYAESASGYASDAQGYANTASQKATEAGNSADRAAQIKTDIEGYVSTAQTAAQTATDKAAQASQSATNASNSATTATTKAGEASASATTASNKASEASGYATTASNKASDASDSATAAFGYKTDAESAKMASQTAQGKAEDAQTAAETAQGLAEDAQEAAESAAASVSASAAQIAQNEADILKAFPTDSASGAIASFTDGADGLPLKSLVVSIDPVQSGTGDPSPTNVRPISGWNAVKVTRCGKNLYSRENGEYNVPVFDTSGNSQSYPDVNAVWIKVKPNTAYTTTLIPNSSRAAYARWIECDEYKNFIWRDSNMNSGSYLTRTRTTRSNTRWVQIACNQYPTAQISNNAWEIMFTEGSTATPYEPYNGVTVTVQLGETVYGGKLDVLSGVLTVTHGMLVKNTSTMDTTNDDYPGWFNSGVKALVGSGKNTTLNCLLNIGTRVGVNTNNINDSVFLTKAIYGKTKNEWIALAMDVQIVVELATPYEIQLTPHEVKSILGTNNIFADTGGTSAEYRADPDLYIQRKMPDVPVDDVQINGTSIVADGVANVPIASANDFGAVKAISSYGIRVDSSGVLRTSVANQNEIKQGTDYNKPITSNMQQALAFFGLAKASGDTTQSQSSNAVGTYTEEAKAKIQSMLGFGGFELIKTVELTEDSANIEIDTDEAGNAFKLTEAIILISAQPSASTTGNSPAYVKNNRFHSITTISGVVRTSATSISGFVKNVMVPTVIGEACISEHGFPNAIGNFYWNGKFPIGTEKDYSDYLSVYTTGTAKFGAGTVLMLFGRRK